MRIILRINARPGHQGQEGREASAAWSPWPILLRHPCATRTWSSGTWQEILCSTTREKTNPGADRSTKLQQKRQTLTREKN